MKTTRDSRTALGLLASVALLAAGCGGLGAPTDDAEPSLNAAEAWSSPILEGDLPTLKDAMAAASEAASAFATHAVAAAPVELVGTGRVPGNATDGLLLTPATLEDGTPHNQLGAFGSGISYIGCGTKYLAAPDRGPADGTTSYLDRYYLVDIAVQPGGATPISAHLASARLLTNGEGNNLVGLAAAYDANNSIASLRLDPEGVRVSGRGTFYASDEYGPFLYEFDARGRRLRSFAIPAKFLIDHPGATVETELPPNNVKGRQPNRGMEGLAITPFGDKLYGIMQNALIQDGGLDAAHKRIGQNNRILEIDVTRRTTRELVYTLESAKNGINEMVAVNRHQFLVLERDGNAGLEAAFKKIFLVDISGATDVSAVDSLPSTGLPAGVVAVEKSLLLDMLAPEFGLAGQAFPEKIEGMTFGPDLADGRRLLLVTSDNDLATSADSMFYAFAIDPALLPEFRRPVIAPAIDIRPGSPINVILTRSPASVPVAILSNGLFDATLVDPKSVTVAGASPRTVLGVPLCSQQDANGDGLTDLVCHIPSRRMRLGPSSRSAVLEARTLTGSPVVGQDSVWVVTLP
jgi:hypothetical protein